MDVYLQALAACSYAYNETPQNFMRTKVNHWTFPFTSPAGRVSEYCISNQGLPINFIPFVQHGLHFMYMYTKYMDSTFYYYQCFMIVDGQVQIPTPKQYSWISLPCSEKELLEMRRWQQIILINQHSKTMALQQELYQYELNLPVDLHCLIVQYVTGITFSL